MILRAHTHEESNRPKNMSESSKRFTVSVVLPTHNPRKEYLARVIEALRQQTLPREQWEIVVVDNGSKQPLAAVVSGKVGMCESGKTDGSSQAVAERPRDEETKEPQVSASLPSHLPTFPPFTELDLSWHPQAKIVREERLGLTFARLRGFAEAKGELIVMVDDDNVLAPDYLETAVRIAQNHPALGAFGGKCLPEFEHEPPHWLKGITSGLGLRDLGEEPVVYPMPSGFRHEAKGKGREVKRRLRIGRGTAWLRVGTMTFV
jgi:glycosyltransferase involved in cell wall biosynthesis